MLKIFIRNLFIVILTITNITNAAKYLSDKPDSLKPCSYEDKSFNKCYANNFQVLFRDWKDGVPGLKTVGKLDPIVVKRIKIVQDPNSGIALSAILDNVEIRGASETRIEEAVMDMQKWTVDVKFTIPKIRFNSDYKGKGNVLSLNFNGSGKAVFEAENLSVGLHITVKLHDIDNFTFTDIQTLSVNNDKIGGFRIHLDNLFNGQKDLEETANAFFNENFREIYAVMRPVILQTVEAILLDRLKKIFNYVPSNFFVENFPKAKDVYH